MRSTGGLWGTTHGALAARLALVACLYPTAGCRGGPSQFTWGRTPAAGATSTCPDDAVDLTGDGTPTTDDVRCSYADVAAGQARVSGKVLEDSAGGLGRGLEGVVVSLVPMDPAGQPGAAVASARTDPQGGFTLRARARSGRYAIVANGAQSTAWSWDGRGPWTLGDVIVRVPPDTASPEP